MHEALKKRTGAWLATAVALGITVAILHETDHPALLASLGGSCIILFGMPGSYMARPYNLFGGHLIAAVIGLAFLKLGHDLVGGNADVWMIAAVSTALVTMMATDSVHSPAGANPVVIFLEHADWTFLVWPLLVGLLVLFATSAVAERLSERSERGVSR
ncbi:MAG: HPP family protein [Rhodospirillales bacterium]